MADDEIGKQVAQMKYVENALIAALIRCGWEGPYPTKVEAVIEQRDNSLVCTKLVLKK